MRKRPCKLTNPFRAFPQLNYVSFSGRRWRVGETQRRLKLEIKIDVHISHRNVQIYRNARNGAWKSFEKYLRKWLKFKTVRAKLTSEATKLTFSFVHSRLGRVSYSWFERRNQQAASREASLGESNIIVGWTTLPAVWSKNVWCWRERGTWKQRL